MVSTGRPCPIVPADRGGGRDGRSIRSADDEFHASGSTPASASGEPDERLRGAGRVPPEHVADGSDPRFVHPSNRNGPDGTRHLNVDGAGAGPFPLFFRRTGQVGKLSQRGRAEPDHDIERGRRLRAEGRERTARLPYRLRVVRDLDATDTLPRLRTRASRPPGR